ncbi:hypothetical protein K3722_11155 [Leisingera caerulea]|uniref:Type IV pilus biogenesis protein PilP n=1 Tax=Leisingera caerulea TaxID=506591 RepID=A0A9Q9M1G6_LEICA|nr:hypothetical protein [Leisingera caerulea]UWQ48461.1 hypothetical protein K3720_10960 [Leisingera caerulea]UWQ52539.1 hypothetical protein K3721_10900 [Leisingera caerulea]UWQ57092.1 hypothetical protein K3722_11155 [Leisingera caerulea]UWQ61368.1 hypothetical protein K3723_10805 [Leisingera caerulea]UWQ82234.1 hypothetical protein K3726_11000 [Leisingera caerulea]
MANAEKAGRTPAKVAGLATQDNAVNRNRLNLLGIYGPENSLTALVRLPNGRTKTVTRGARLSSLGQVVAIDAHGLILSARGETKRLSMPGS